MTSPDDDGFVLVEIDDLDSASDEVQDSASDEVQDSASDDGQASIAKQKRLADFRALLAAASPSAAKGFNSLLRRFRWDLISVLDMQDDLREIVMKHERVVESLDFYSTHIAPFLHVEINGAEDFMKAKEILHQTFPLVTRAESRAIELKGAKLLKDVEERLHLEQTFRNYFIVFQSSGWRTLWSTTQLIEERRRDLANSLRGHEDLTARVKELLPLFAEEEDFASDSVLARWAEL